VGSDFINRSVRDAVWVTGGCGVGVDFFGIGFFTTGGLTTAFGLTGFGLTGAACVGVAFFVTCGAGLGTEVLLPPLRPSMMIFPSWVYTSTQTVDWHSSA
jgi:hypothetical protein